MDKNLHLRNKLSNEELPKELAWENVADGILAEVIETPALVSEVVVFKTPALKYLSILATLFFAGALILLLLVPDDRIVLTNQVSETAEVLETKNVDRTSSTITKSDSVDRTPTHQYTNEQTTTTPSHAQPALKTNRNNDITTSKALNDKSRSSTTIESSINETSDPKTNATANPILQKPASASLANDTDNQIATKQTTVIQQQTNASSSTTKSSILPSSEEQNQTSILAASTNNTPVKQQDQNRFLEPPASLSSALLAIKFNKEKEGIESVVTVTSPPAITPVKMSRLAIELGAGTNLINPNYSGSDLSTLRQANEHSVPGLSSSLAIRYQLDKNWAISTGVQYQSLATKLDYYNTWDTIVTRPKQIIEVNSLNGESSEYYIDTEVETFAYDSVIHYNSIRVISIPLIVTKSWASFKGVRLETSLGLSYGIATSAEGKHIYKTTNETKDYSVRPISSQQYKSKANALAGIGLSYPVTERFYLSGTLGGSYALNSWTNNSSRESSHPLIFDAVLKLGFKL